MLAQGTNFAQRLMMARTNVFNNTENFFLTETSVANNTENFS